MAATVGPHGLSGDCDPSTPPGGGEVVARAEAPMDVVVDHTDVLHERVHILVREREVEDPHVLRDPLAVRRLGDQRNVALDAPAEQHLGVRPRRCAIRVTVSLARWRPWPSGL
jgi:hypothetical protein